MPNRFSAAFRRKSTAGLDDFQTIPTAPAEQPSSFRVLERNPPSGGRTFDGGARMARAPASRVHKPSLSDPEVEDNMFAGLNTYRGSGGSNTTKATSTDASSRHSNASTAPSSADMAHNHDDGRAAKRVPPYEPAGRQSQKAGGSFLDRAGRTFSFGMQKKNSQPPPKEEPIPDMPPLPSFQREDEHGRTRALTASTTSTATPPKLEGGSGMDLGGDFGSMFTGFDKRSSAATLRNEPPPGQRPGAPIPLTVDTTSAPDQFPGSWSSQNSSDNLMSSSTISPAYDRPAQVPRHQPSFEYRSAANHGGAVEDADAKFLADSVAATKFLSDGTANNGQASGRYGRDEGHFSVAHRRPVAAEFEGEDNMFAGTAQRFSRPAYGSTAARAPSPPRGSKVMTTAQFERYQKEKEREHLERAVYGGSAEDDDDDDDDINYDDEEDEDEKLKAQAKFRRNKQAQMMAYRQKNMKTTGNLGHVSPTPSSRPSLPSSLSAPHLGVAKTPSPEPPRRTSGDDDDEEIPLAILQAHGFPSKNRASSRLSVVGGSNPNLRASSMAQGGAAGSTLGEPSSTSAKRTSTLPVFARGLPQDIPYYGSDANRPAVRESLPYGGGAPANPPQPQHQSMHPGGLVGVIASEERARAMRRGSPNTENQRLSGVPQNFDPVSGIPPHMMYERGAQPSMQRMSQSPPLSAADQAQMQMNQQMTQFMQMQMQFMQMMTGSGQQPQMAYQMPPNMQQMQQQMQQQMSQQQQPYGMFAGTQSQADLSSGQSVAGFPASQPRRLNPSMRTMSMVQPNTSSAYLQNGFGSPGQGPGAGYTPSIAPSERSNVGLPGRYRPVSQASGSIAGLSSYLPRPASMSGAMSLSLSQNDDSKSRSTIKAVSKTKADADDDDEEGWEAMRTKREQKKSRWRRRKGSDA